MAIEMFSAGAEQLQHDPELAPLTPTEQAILDAMTLEKDAHVGLQSLFQTARDQLLAAQATPDQRLAVQAVSDKIAWELFGMANEPLPTTLAVDASDPEVTIVTYNPGIPFGLDGVEYDLRKNTFAHVLTIQEVHLQYNQSKIESAVVNHVKNERVYAFLQAFDTKQPADPAQKPLTPFVRQIRESQVNQEVKGKFGIEEYWPIQPHSEAGIALKRGLQALDDETMPLPQAKPKSAFERFNAYILPIAQQWVDACPEHYGTGTVQRILYEGGPFIEIAGERHDCGDDICDWAYDLQKTLRATDYPGYLAYEFLIELYDSANQNKEYSHLLDTAAYITARDYVQELGDTFMHVRALTKLRRPIGITYTSLSETPRRTVDLARPWQSADIFDAEGLAQEMNKTIGWIDRYDERAASRLIIETCVPRRSVPTDTRTSAYADLGISFEPSSSYEGLRNFHRQHNMNRGIFRPMVPGYTTHETGPDMYDFVRETDDPYAVAHDVQIEDTNKLQLASTYTELGLDALGEALAANYTLSAAELAGLIASHSDYTFNSSLGSLRYDAVKDIDAFKQFVQNGRLQVQCTGAAAFLGRSLEIALPGCGTATISGNVIGNDRRISGVKHAQTQAVYNGVRFIADATPSLPDGALADKLPGHIGQAPWERPHIDTSDALDHNVIESHQLITGLEPIPEIETITRAEAFSKSPLDPAARQRQVVQLLRIAFDLPNDARLYETVARLPYSDPTRRALSATMQTDTPVAEQSMTTEAYLEAYADATEDMLRNARLRRYDPQLLRSLAAVLRS